MPEDKGPGSAKKRAEERAAARKKRAQDQAAAKEARKNAKAPAKAEEKPAEPAPRSEDAPSEPRGNIEGGGYGLKNEGEYGLIGVLRDFLRVITTKDAKQSSVQGMMEFLSAFEPEQLTEAANGLSKEEQDKLKIFTPGLFKDAGKGTVKATTEADQRAQALKDVKDILTGAGKGGDSESAVNGPDIAAELYKAGKISAPEFQDRLRNFGVPDNEIQDVQILLDKSITGSQEGAKQKSLFDENTIIKLYHNNQISEGDAINRLTEIKSFDDQGKAYNLSDNDARMLLKKPRAVAGGEGGGGGRGGGGGGGRSTVRNTRRYVDIPSNADFLNDFRNGFATHLKGMASSLGPDVAMWAIDNMEFFLNDYLGELGTMAQSGQSIYTVPSAGAQPSEVSTTKTTEKAGGAGGDGGETDTFTETVTEVPRTGNNPVFTLSPAVHLGTKFNAPAIRTLFEGQRGARAAQSRTGGAVSPRRV